MHRFRDVWRTEIHYDRAWLRRLLVEEMLTPGRGLKRRRHCRGLEMKIEETRPRDFNLVAPLPDVQLAQHVGGELPRIQLSLLGQGHERSRLVIAEPGIRTRTHLD